MKRIWRNQNGIIGYESRKKQAEILKIPSPVCLEVSCHKKDIPSSSLPWWVDLSPHTKSWSHRFKPNRSAAVHVFRFCPSPFPTGVQATMKGSAVACYGLSSFALIHSIHPPQIGCQIYGHGQNVPNGNAKIFIHFFFDFSFKRLSHLQAWSNMVVVIQVLYRIFTSAKRIQVSCGKRGQNWHHSAEFPKGYCVCWNPGGAGLTKLGGKPDFGQSGSG